MDSLMKIESLSGKESPHIGLLPFINEVLWFLHPLKSVDSYEPNKAEYIEKRLRNELSKHTILIILMILNYLLTILELYLNDIEPSSFSFIHGIWFLIIFLSFIRLFFFLEWRKITSQWILTGKEIDSWRKNLEIG
jgi:hypothetical protein